MTLPETLAVAAIRRWCYDRQKLKNGETVSYKRSGWAERRQRDLDARLVRVLDFEKIFQTLTSEEQIMLTLAHCNGYTEAEMSAMTNLSVRSIATYLPQTRYKLAMALDAVDLL